MDWSTFLFVDLGIITLVISAAAWALGKYAFAKISNENIRGLLERLWVGASRGVSSANQIYVDEIKKGREDGKLTDEEKKTALNLAMAEAKRYYTSEFWAQLIDFAGSEKAAEELVKTEIEAVIAKKKRNS